MCDKLPRVGRQLVEEQYEIPAIKLVKHSNGWHEQRPGIRYPPYILADGLRDSQIQKTVWRVRQAKFRPHAAIPHIQHARDVECEPPDSTSYGHRSKRRIGVLNKVARPLRQGHTHVTGQIESWLPLHIPPVVRSSSSIGEIEDVGFLRHGLG